MANKLWQINVNVFVNVLRSKQQYPYPVSRRSVDRNDQSKDAKKQPSVQMATAAGAAAAQSRGGIRRSQGSALAGEGGLGATDVLPGMMPEDDFGLSLEAQELAELQGMIGSSTVGSRRTPPMSVGKYRQWKLVEANIGLAQQIRAEEQALKQKLFESTHAYHEARKAKTSVGHMQLRLSADAVQKYHAQLAIQGAEGKRQLEEIRDKAIKQKAEWAAHGARNANLHGLEQKKRVLESRAERFQSRRNAALATKQESEAKKAEARERMNKVLEEKRLRLEKTREGLPTAESLAAARDFFLEQKREAARDVRKSSERLESARKKDSERSLARAAANRTVAFEGRKAATQHRTEILEMRKTQAKEIKERLKTLEAARQQTVIAATQSGKAAHQEVYEKRFVSQEEAEEVHSSEYGTLLQRVRTPGVMGKSGTSPGRDRSSRISQEEIRLDSNSPVSPSSDLLGGSPKQAWTEPALELS